MIEGKELNEKMKEVLGSAGAEEGAWSSTSEKEVDLTTVASFEEGKKAVAQIGSILNMQISKDQRAIDSLREKIERLKHGGMH